MRSFRNGVEKIWAKFCKNFPHNPCYVGRLQVDRPKGQFSKIRHLERSSLNKYIKRERKFNYRKNKQDEGHNRLQILEEVLD